jgi:outer membrane receptor protein involved in Fe transport
MSRSRRRKLERLNARRHASALVKGVPLASVLLAGMPVVHAQDDNGKLEEVVVSAQKRDENLQTVPLSITALGATKLEEMQVVEFADYAKLLPSVSYQSLGPGATAVYMRGLASGENANHSGPLPQVGIYLDEQPVTTIQGALDIHVYDVARVEALAGPQGTLYGASSQAGTLRIITNKPDPSAFKAGYDLTGSTVNGGDQGYLAEGFVNIPLSSNAAVRIVAWDRKDPGYIDNVAKTLTYPSLQAFDQANGNPRDGTISNAGRLQKNYNDVSTYGARAALRVDLNDNWSITPGIMGQKQNSDGSFAEDPRLGDLKVGHFKPEYQNDTWWQAALTVEGRIANLDLTYAGSHLKRDIHSSSDYADYSYFYDVNYGSGAYIYNANGDLIDPTQYFEGFDRFTKDSQEIRIASDPTNRFRFVAGVFWQRQEHGIQQRYKIDGLSPDISVPGWPDTIWLTQQARVDEDKALFGEVTYDITPKLSVIGGMRFFKSDNSLRGFFGYGAGFSSRTGEAACFEPGPFRGAPCIDLDREVKEDGHTPRLTFNYKIDDSKMVYATYSKGFRPGGVNRRRTEPPDPPVPPSYVSDFIKNYELGWKTSWADDRLRFNGAVYWEDWDNIQFSYLGINGLTIIRNATSAQVKGIEGSINWAVTGAFSLTGGFAYNDAKLTANYCGELTDDGSPITECAAPLAPDGTQLPISSKFKGNLTGRYQFPLMGGEGHFQGSYAYRGAVWADLRLPDRAVMGQQPSYGEFDFSTGLNRGAISLELFVHNAFDKRADMFRTTQCSVLGPDNLPLCGLAPLVVVNTPRTIGIRFGQKF